jgi:hypothetical protein
MNDREQNSKILEISNKKKQKDRENETLTQIKKEQERLEKLIEDYKSVKKLMVGTKHELIRNYLEDGCNPSLLPYAVDPKIKHGTYNVWCHWADNSKNPRLIELDKKTKTAIEIGKLKHVGIIDECLRRFANPDYPSTAFCLSAKEIEALSTKIRSNGRSIKEWPKTIGFKSDTEYCFKRNDFDPWPKPTSYSDFPTVALNLENMTNAKNFCERVGSLYDPKANRKQIIFMVGGGDGGKSTLLNILTMLAGGVENVATISKKVFDTHGYAPLLNKRVWIAEELNKSFFKNEKSKELTGGAPVLINQKNEPLFSAYLTGMLFCVSNDMPEFGDDSGLRNRLIICELDPIPHEKRLSEFETLRRMKQELPYFVRYCMDAYAKVGKDGSLIPDSTECLESIIEENETEVSVIFEEYLEIDLTTLGKYATVSTTDYQMMWERICYKHPAFAKNNTRKMFDNYVKKQLNRKTVAIVCKVRGKSKKMVSGLRIR